MFVCNSPISEKTTRKPWKNYWQQEGVPQSYDITLGDTLLIYEKLIRIYYKILNLQSKLRVFAWKKSYPKYLPWVSLTLFVPIMTFAMRNINPPILYMVNKAVFFIDTATVLSL